MLARFTSGSNIQRHRPSLSLRETRQRVSFAAPSKVQNRNFSKRSIAFRGAQESGTTEIQTNKFGAVGVEKAELEGHFRDLKAFNSVVDQSFGTKDKPVNVLSEFEGRIVGCRGGPKAEDEHEILWHFVKEAKPTMCLECGQVFKLTRVGDHHGEPGEHGEHSHDSHGHSADSHSKSSDSHGHSSDSQGQGSKHSHGSHH